MTHPIERASVEQADREAAANIMIGEGARNGFMDDHPWVQAFARHRQQARDAGFAEGVSRAAELAEAYSKRNDKPYRELINAPLATQVRYEGHHYAGMNIAVAIRALSVEANEGRCDG